MTPPWSRAPWSRPPASRSARRSRRRRSARSSTLKHIDLIRKFFEGDVAKVKETLATKKLSEPKRKELRGEIKTIEGEMMEHLEAIQLNKKQIDRIVLLRLKGFIKRVEEAERELGECERAASVPVREPAVAAPARDARGRGGAQEAREEARGRWRTSRSSTARWTYRKMLRVQEEAEVPVEELRRHLPGLHLDGEYKAERAKTEPVARTRGSSCRS